MALIKVNNRGQSADFSTEIGATKNLIINGGFDVWQRGTSLSITTSNFRIADQWVTYPGSSGSGTASRQSFALGQTDVPGEPNYYLRMDMTGAASSAPNIQHRIEDVRTAAGQEVTLSFYAKCGSGTVVVDPIIRQYFGTGGSPSSSVDISPNDITLTTSWQRFTRTFTMGSLSGKTLGTDNMHQIQIRLQLPTSTTYTVDIAQVQFEIGDTATTFEHRSYGEELALCSRYYHTSFSGETTIGGSHPANYSGKVFSWCDHYGSSPDRVAFNYQWPVQMRDLPTVTMYGNAWTSGRMSKYNGGATEYTIDYASGISRNGLGGYYDIAGTNGDFVVAYVEASAEL